MFVYLEKLPFGIAAGITDMSRIKPDRVVIVAVALGLSLVVTGIAGRVAANRHHNQTELLLLAQQLDQGAALVATESRLILQDSQALAAMQRVNDRNIAAYQLLTQGSVKRDLPPLADLVPDIPPSLEASFGDFQASVSDLIQSRRLLEQALQGKDEVIKSAERLAIQAQHLADGLEQQDGELLHLRAVYRVHAAMIAHVQAIQQTYTMAAAPPVLPLDQLRTDLITLSTDAKAPQSPAIRRTAANLLNQLDGHLQTMEGVQAQHTASAKIARLQESLQQHALTLQQQLDSVTSELYSYMSFALYLAMALGISSLTLAAMLGYHWRRVPTSLAATAEIAEQATANLERTTPNFMSQFKTEKNLLMNDIKPIGEGILYIKADEHLESTGDVARCLNQSRESLIRRIEQLKRQVAELQNALDASDAGQSTGTIHPTSTSNSTDNARLIDLTFKGHAELDGLQRLLKAQPGLDREQAKQLLLRCIKTDRVLDEIRVRLKKTDGDIEQPGNGNGSDPGPTQKTVQLQKVTTLVAQLVEHLEEFQTQPGKSRRSRGVTP